MRRTIFFVPFLVTLAACVVETTNTDGQKPDPQQPARACVAPTGAPVEHSGEVTGETLWKADSVHIVRGSVNVRDGARLTIEPCAVVRMDAGASINVAYPLTPNQGELVALGAADKPIKIEPLDGARWDHIKIAAPGKARFAHVTIEGGGGDDTQVGESLYMAGDGALPVERDLFVDHVTIRGSLGPGLRIDGGAGFAEGSTDLVITGSGSEAHPSALELGEYALDSLPTGSYTGNRKDQIFIDPGVVSAMGGLQVDATIHDRGVPYVVGETPGIDEFSIGWGNDDFVQPVLTIEPGVTMRFLKGSGFHVEGTEKGGAATIKAIGTAEKPIVFTSAEPSPKPGDWRGFYFNGRPAAGNAMEHVRLEYTGADCACSLVSCTKGIEQYEAAIIFARQPAGAFLKNSVIAQGSGHGVVQGYDGTDFDWKATNTFDSVAGCPQTAPRQPDTHCPDPAPACK